ncbi:MAG: DUF2236 domain-containing protein [Thermoanaerobaculia bacterium]|nr:DUF2236 domain-containing protein [Thermoanaerobaculia bacterium]
MTDGHSADAVAESEPVEVAVGDAGRWSDDTFLDRIRDSVDDRADRAVRELRADELTASSSGKIFAAMAAEPGTSGGLKPEDLPGPMADFFEDTEAVHREMLPGIDEERMRRGKEFFHRYAAQSCLVMLASSLPNGYAAPCLSRVLTVSDDLSHHPYQRLLGVLQLLVNITNHDSHGHEGYGFVTAQKLRLLHAGIRAIVPRVRTGYVERFGQAVNHEDMLATIMGFSHLVVEGCRTFGVDVTEEEAEDYWYLWRQFSRMMGIAPTTDPMSEEFVPQTYADAKTFYDAYTRRQYEQDASKNPEGALLAQQNLKMMKDLIPGWLRVLGAGRMPLIAMQQLLGDHGMRRVGIQPLSGHLADRRLFHALLGLVLRGERKFPSFTERLAMLILGEMIEGEMGGEVTFLIPMTVGDMELLTQRDGVAVRQEGH